MSDREVLWSVGHLGRDRPSACHVSTRKNLECCRWDGAGHAPHTQDVACGGRAPGVGVLGTDASGVHDERSMQRAVAVYGDAVVRADPKFALAGSQELVNQSGTGVDTLVAPGQVEAAAGDMDGCPDGPGGRCQRRVRLTVGGRRPGGRGCAFRRCVRDCSDCRRGGSRRALILRWGGASGECHRGQCDSTKRQPIHAGQTPGDVMWLPVNAMSVPPGGGVLG